MPLSLQEDTLTATAGPLAGYVVLDFTQILAGPFTTQMFADAGATVIKVEPPGGEFSRIRGPKRTTAKGQIISSYSAAVNRGKRSICLDLKNPEGLRIAEQLIAQSDVVIENFTPGAFDRLGLGSKKLREARPELVTCSISLFGGFETAGDLAKRGGLSIVAESESSVAGMQRHKDGSPLPLGLPLGDMGSGMAAYGAIVTALLVRERTGVGQHVDISMVKTLLAFNAINITGEQIIAGQGVELRALRTAGYGIFPAADGYVTIAVNTDRLWGRLAEAMGQDWMAGDPRFAHYVERDKNIADVTAAITQWSSARSAAEVVETITRFGVPGGLVATPHDILSSDAIAELGFLEEVDDGLGRVIRVPGNPIGWRQPTYAIPRTDEHSEELMAERLGIAGEEYEKLRTAGAFGPVAEV